MTLREVTRTAIKLVEGRERLPGGRQRGPVAHDLGRFTIARGVNRTHSISFNPSAVREPLQQFYDEEDPQGPRCRVASGARTTTA